MSQKSRVGVVREETFDTPVAVNAADAWTVDGVVYREDTRPWSVHLKRRGDNTMVRYMKDLPGRIEVPSLDKTPIARYMEEGVVIVPDAMLDIRRVRFELAWSDAPSRTAVYVDVEQYRQCYAVARNKPAKEVSVHFNERCRRMYGRMMYTFRLSDAYFPEWVCNDCGEQLGVIPGAAIRVKVTSGSSEKSGTASCCVSGCTGGDREATYKWEAMAARPLFGSFPFPQLPKPVHVKFGVDASHALKTFDSIIARLVPGGLP